MAEKALAAVIQAYIQGVSTRSVDDLVQAMGMSGVSKSQVSRLCGEIDDKVNGFLDRSLEGDWPYGDASIVSVAVTGPESPGVPFLGVIRENRRHLAKICTSELETRLRLRRHRLRPGGRRSAKAQWRQVADQLRPKVPKRSSHLTADLHHQTIAEIQIERSRSSAAPTSFFPTKPPSHGVGAILREWALKEIHDAARVPHAQHGPALRAGTRSTAAVPSSTDRLAFQLVGAVDESAVRAN